ncbi:hypothetical protein K439DRAFT_1543511 [Ramaria rubella]|nr:hypothetical protein K439DRAFT_1543511 [Ramaria rubella]
MPDLLAKFQDLNHSQPGLKMTHLKAEAQYLEPEKQAEGSNTAVEIATGHALLAMLNAGAGDQEVSWDSPKEMVSEVEKELARDAQALASDTGDNDEDAWMVLMTCQKPLGQVLNSMAHWLDLLERAGKEKAGMESTKSHGKKVKVLEVILFNVQGTEKEEKGKHKGKGKKGDMSRSKCKRGSDSDDMSDGDNAGTSSDQAHWVLALQKKYQCDEHAEGHCKVGLGGVHLELKASQPVGIVASHGQAFQLQNLVVGMGFREAAFSTISLKGRRFTCASMELFRDLIFGAFGVSRFWD